MEQQKTLTKDEAAKQEKKRISALFSAKKGDSKEEVAIKRKLKATVKSLIDEAAFMAGSLYELRQIIDEKGYTEEYQNGQYQKGIKKTSEIEIYNTMIKNYMNCMKQLTDLLPKEDMKAPEPDDDFDEFANSK